MPLPSAGIEEASRLLSRRGMLQELLKPRESGCLAVLALANPKPDMYNPPVRVQFYLDDVELGIVVASLMQRIDARLADLGVEA